MGCVQLALLLVFDLYSANIQIGPMKNHIVRFATKLYGYRKLIATVAFLETLTRRSHIWFVIKGIILEFIWTVIP
jgi:hypothetical protein